ncbi:hypothetical protein ACQEVI_16160 [Promicromonospora sp. CA-289599]|uniref:hypothetical protein n=1 Tax=Promicromonospora sp. CA-289599 TaxID=3240014 RepID=UPI003D8F273E
MSSPTETSDVYGTRASRRRSRIVLAGLIALTMTLTTACTSRSDVTVAQLQERSEQIGQSLTATIDGVDRYQDDHAGGGLRWENAEVNDEDPNGRRYWQWDATIVFAADAQLTPEQAADRMIKVLEADGWTAGEPALDTGSDRLGFHKSDDLGEGWSVEITYWKDPPPDPQNLFVTVVSPSTNRP